MCVHLGQRWARLPVAPGELEGDQLYRVSTAQTAGKTEELLDQRRMENA